MTKPRKPILPPAKRRDFSQELVRCAAPGCEVEKPIGEMMAYKIMLFISGHPLVSAQECAAIHHFGCSYEHALLVAHACLDEHIHPAHRTAVESHLTTEEAPDGER